MVLASYVAKQGQKALHPPVDGALVDQDPALGQPLAHLGVTGVRQTIPAFLTHLVRRWSRGAGMSNQTAGTWPRTKAIYCYRVDVEDWPDEPEIVERAPVRS